MVLALAIAATLSVGVADYFAGVTLRSDGRMDSALMYTSVGSVLGAVIVLVLLPLAPAEEFSNSDIAWSIAAGIAVGLALPLLMIGMAKGPMAVVAPVLGLVSMAVPAIAGPLLGDNLTVLEVLGLLISFPAAALISRGEFSNGPAAPLPEAIAIAAAAGALFGSSAVFFGQTSTDSGIGPGVVAQATTATLLVIAMLVARRAKRPHKTALVYAASVGILTALAVFFSVLAYQRGPVAVVAAIIGLAPGPTVLLAWSLAKERIVAIQYAGFALGVAAVILFALG